jgi:hypothetical protein
MYNKTLYYGTMFFGKFLKKSRYSQKRQLLPDDEISEFPKYSNYSKLIIINENRKLT